jgi:hypothetical protein
MNRIDEHDNHGSVTPNLDDEQDQTEEEYTKSSQVNLTKIFLIGHGKQTFRCSPIQIKMNH